MLESVCVLLRDLVELSRFSCSLLMAQPRSCTGGDTPLEDFSPLFFSSCVTYSYY